MYEGDASAMRVRIIMASATLVASISVLAMMWVLIRNRDCSSSGNPEVAVSTGPDQVSEPAATADPLSPPQSQTIAAENPTANQPATAPAGGPSTPPETPSDLAGKCPEHRDR